MTKSFTLYYKSIDGTSHNKRFDSEKELRLETKKIIKLGIYHRVCITITSLEKIGIGWNHG